MSDKFSKVDIDDKWSIFLSVDGNNLSFATRHGVGKYDLDNIHTNAAWKIQSLNAERDTYKDALKAILKIERGEYDNGWIDAAYVATNDIVNQALSKHVKCEHGEGLTEYCEPCGRIHSS